MHLQHIQSVGTQIAIFHCCGSKVLRCGTPLRYNGSPSVKETQQLQHKSNRRQKNPKPAIGDQILFILIYNLISTWTKCK